MSIKVLVADDSITIQKVIGIIFSGEEYSLTVVDNGKSAVDSAREINPDILLIDALMPGMSGYEVAEAIRATPYLAAKPILILTGSFEPFDEERARKCGADDFISKPFESQQIISKVKELLELGRSRLQAATAQTELDAGALETEMKPVITADSSHTLHETAEPEVPADIWGAFTAVEEPLVEKTTEPVELPGASFEPDVFAIVSEENDAQLSQAGQTSITPSQQTVTQWIPVEENTFEFEEMSDHTADITQPVSAVQEISFDEVSFEEEITPSPVLTETSTVYAEIPPPAFDSFSEPSHAFAESPVVAEEPQTVQVQPPTASTQLASANLNEDQLRAALAATSRDVIERIVWEIVPDLAEAMIRDAIQKIKDGV